MHSPLWSVALLLLLRVFLANTRWETSGCWPAEQLKAMFRYCKLHLKEQEVHSWLASSGQHRSNSGTGCCTVSPLQTRELQKYSFMQPLPRPLMC